MTAQEKRNLGKKYINRTKRIARKWANEVLCV